MEVKTQEDFAEYARRIVIVIVRGRPFICSVTTVVVVPPKETEARENG